jgi:hypothetical protein
MEKIELELECCDRTCPRCDPLGFGQPTHCRVVVSVLRQGRNRVEEAYRPLAEYAPFFTAVPEAIRDSYDRLIRG